MESPLNVGGLASPVQHDGRLRSGAERRHPLAPRRAGRPELLVAPHVRDHHADGVALGVRPVEDALAAGLDEGGERLGVELHRGEVFVVDGLIGHVGSLLIEVLALIEVPESSSSPDHRSAVIWSVTRSTSRAWSRSHHSVTKCRAPTIP